MRDRKIADDREQVGDSVGAVIKHVHRYGFISLADLPDRPIGAEAVLFGDLLYRGGVSLLSGVAGIGKTTLARGIAYAVATGTEFCSFTGPDGGVPVLYLDYETAGPYLVMRWKRVCGDDLSSGANVFVNINHDVFDAEAIAHEVKRHQAGLLVVDTLIRATQPRDENDNAEMSGIMDGFDVVAREANCAVLIITHESKVGGGSARGASAIGASPAVVVNFRRASTDKHVAATGGVAYTLVIDKNRLGGDDPIELVRDGDGGFQLAQGCEGGVAVHDAERAILDTAREAGGPIQRKDLIVSASARLGAGQSVSDRTIERALDRLYDLGRIARPSRGFYALPGQKVPA